MISDKLRNIDDILMKLWLEQEFKKLKFPPMKELPEPEYIRNPKIINERNKYD